MNKILLLVLVFVLKITNVNAKTCYSIENGNWSDAGTWSCNPSGVPECGDIIIISAGTTVTFSNNTDWSTGACATAVTTLIIDGTLHFTGGGKLTLANGSDVIVNPGGSITAANYNGNNNLINIGAQPIWNAGADPPLGGPVSGPWANGNSTLPITLSSFYPKVTDQNITLFWTTESEQNNEFFYLERSKDGIEWHAIAVLDGANNSSSVIHYSYTDHNPIHGQSFYRLKQTDYDGEFSYSKVVVVKFEYGSIPSFYPNPSSGVITVIESNDIKNVKILDLQGKVIEVLKASKNPIYNLEKLNNGVYLIQFESETSIFTEKLIIQK